MSEPEAPVKHMRGKRITPRMVCDEWWEAHAPDSWQGGQCPHGTEYVAEGKVSDVLPFPKGVKKLPFLEWLVANQTMLTTAVELAYEAERRYLALQNLVLTIPTPQDTPYPYRLLWWGKSYEDKRWNRSWHHNIPVQRTSQFAVSLDGTGSWFWGSQTRANPKWYSAWDRIGVANRLYDQTWLKHDRCGMHGLMGRLLDEAFPKNTPLNPFDPLVDLWVRFGIMTVNLRPAPMDTEPASKRRTPLVGLLFPPEAYKLDGVPP